VEIGPWVEPWGRYVLYNIIGHLGPTEEDVSYPALLIY